MKSTFILAAAFFLVQAANAQGVSAPSGLTAANSRLLHKPSQMPPMLVSQFLALGDRLQKPGHERIHLAGMMTTSNGSSNVQIVMELGGKLNITWANQPNNRVVFNGTGSTILGTIANSNDFLETFVDDLPEALMLTAGNGTLPRLLGRGFSDHAGGFCDYYDVPTTGQAVKHSKVLVKRYCFDPKTSLLRNVRYRNSSSQDVITEFGAWGTVNNQAVPGMVTRIVGGHQVFQFQSQSTALSPTATDNTFTAQ